MVLPDSYHPIVAAVTSSAAAVGKPLETSQLIALIEEQYDSKPHKSTDNVALATRGGGRGGGGRGRGRTGGNSKSKGCHNCGCTNHFVADCFAKGSPKYKGNDSKNESANQASTSSASGSSKMNLAFMAMTRSETAAALTALTNLSTMIIDTGASCHFTSERELMKNFVNIKPEAITVADGHDFSATGRGDLEVTLPNGDSSTSVTLKNVLYAATMPATLISVEKMDAAGCELRIRGGICSLYGPDGVRFATIPKYQGLYGIAKASSSAAQTEPMVHTALAARRVSVMDLHAILGHISPSTALEMVRK